VFGNVDNAAAGRIVVSGGGYVTFYGDVNNDGSIQVSTGGAAVFFGSFGGDVIFGTAAGMEVEIAGDGVGQYDRVDIAGYPGLWFDVEYGDEAVSLRAAALMADANLADHYGEHRGGRGDRGGVYRTPVCKHPGFSHNLFNKNDLRELRGCFPVDPVNSRKSCTCFTCKASAIPTPCWTGNLSRLLPFTQSPFASFAASIPANPRSP